MDCQIEGIRISTSLFHAPPPFLPRAPSPRGLYSPFEETFRTPVSSGTSAEIVAQLPADSVLRRFAPHLRLSDGCAEACYRDFRIKSAFQPIFSFAHNRPVGFEGLARAWHVGGAVVSPGALLSVERSTEGVVLDRK